MPYRRKTARHPRGLPASPNRTRQTRMVLCPCCGRHAPIERFEPRAAQVRVLQAGGYKGIAWGPPRPLNAAEVGTMRRVLRAALEELA